MLEESGSRGLAGHWTVTISPEHEIVLRCARVQADPAAQARIRALIRCGVHWPDVVANAMRHRLTPVVYENINATAQELIPPDQLIILQQAARASAANAFVLLRGFLRLYQLFETSEIPIIPYKGPILAWVGYGSFTRRDYTDLDFVVQQNTSQKRASC